MRLWILFVGGVLILGAAIWPLGKRTEQLAPAPVPPVIAAKIAPTGLPKPEPAKVIEVIDLARAYEPVREPEEPAGEVNPASLIQVPDGPRRIPAAIDVDNPPADVFRTAWESATGPLIWNGQSVDRIDFMPWVISPVAAPVERLDVMPREVIRIGNGLLDFVPTPRLVFTPMGVPYTDVAQPIQNGLLNFTPTDTQPTVERLDVMPHEVPTEGTLDYVMQMVRGAEGCTRGWDCGWADDEAVEIVWPLPAGRASFIPMFHGELGFVQDDRPAKAPQLIAVRSLIVIDPDADYRLWAVVKRACATVGEIVPHVMRLP